MCRNIKPLYNLTPPSTGSEIRAAALQFARKLSGFGKTSARNQAAIDTAVDDLSIIIHRLLDSLVTTSGPKDRAIEVAKAQLRSEQRFG